MELKSIIGSQVIRLMAISPSQEKPTSFLSFLKKVEDQFYFLQGPRLHTDYNLKKGITFFKGEFEGFLIERLSLFTNGILCELPATTDAGDAFLDKLLTWGNLEFNAFPNYSGSNPHFYESAIEIHADINLAQSFKKYSSIETGISTALQKYGQRSAEFKPFGFRLHCDTTKLGENDLFPSAFTFEHRANHPFSSNLFYSSAPLRTDDHLSALQALERALRN